MTANARVPIVFISSTSDDLAEYRAAARDAALQAGFFPSMMEYFTAGGQHRPLAQCLQRVTEADLVIVIVAHRYGWIPPEQQPPEQKSVTWLECDHARTLSKEVVPLLVDPGVNWPAERREEARLTSAMQKGEATPQLFADVQRALDQLRAFKTWLDAEALRKGFASCEDLGQQVAHALHEWRNRNPGFGRADAPLLDEREVLVAYRRELVKACQFLPLRGIDIEAADPTRGGSRVELAKVYVTLNTTAAVSERDHPAAAPKAWWRRFLEVVRLAEPTRGDDSTVRRALRGREDTRPLGALEAIVQQRQIVLLGGPGSGKSTLLSFLTFCLAQHHLDPAADWLGQLEVWPHAEADIVPVTVVLRDFAQYLASREPSLPDLDRADLLLSFIDDRQSALSLRSVMRPLTQALDAGHAIVMLDGLDEVPTTEGRAAVRRAVQAFCRRFDRSRFVVTCRTLSYQDRAAQLDGFPSFELAPFAEEQVDAFIAAWYAELRRLGQIDDSGSAANRDRLQAAARRPDLSELARNPLLLTVMALVNTHKGRLPDARAQLYEEVVEILLWRWESRRGDDAVGLRQLLRQAGKADSDLKRVLWEVAFTSQARGQSAADSALSDIGESELLRALGALHPAGRAPAGYAWAVQLIELMKLRAGLLLERVPGTFTFPHRTFQEYMAGSHLSVQEDFVRRGAALADDAATWRPTLLLAVGRLVHVTGSIERPVALANELCPASCDPSHATDAQARRIWLAGEILTEIGASRAAGLASGLDVLDRARRALAQLVGRGVLTPVERAGLGTALGQLGDPRFDATHWHLPDPPLGFVKVPAGEFLMGSDSKRDQYASDDEQPQHKLMLPECFIARSPVTVAQFRAFVDDAHYAVGDPACLRGVANHPVVRVSWHEALAYCRWLTEKLRAWSDPPVEMAEWLDRTIRDGWQVTLPTEAQWEKAARGTDGRIYPWGDTFESNRLNGSMTGIGETSAVGLFPGGASPCGALDMSGNVWEWTRSLWGDDWRKATFKYPYRPDDGREKIDAGDVVLRVVRGGSFVSGGNGVRAADRSRGYPSNRITNFGFRVVASCPGT